MRLGNMSAQPETRAMANQMERGGFSLSVTLEGGSLLTTYPYDRPTEPGDFIDYVAQNESAEHVCSTCISSYVRLSSATLAHNEETLRYLASVYASNHPVMHLGYPGCGNGLGMKYFHKYSPLLIFQDFECYKLELNLFIWVVCEVPTQNNP